MAMYGDSLLRAFSSLLKLGSGLPKYIIKNANDGGTYTYTGFAVPGSGITEAKWLIIRETDTSGDLLFAEGATEPVLVWDNSSISGALKYDTYTYK